jgi:predicted alpha/beta-fold hydrolase
VAQVRVPMLLVTSEDDPFVPYVSFLAARVADNPAIQFVPTEQGGHCGYISKHAGVERFWAEERIAEFCDKIYRVRN